MEINGGSASLVQTRLWLHFPGNREFNRQIVIFGLDLGALSADKTQISRRLRPAIILPRPNHNREWILAIRDLDFPDRPAKASFLGFFC
jgi:hypothetical protein